jgi:cell wall-associated NlpC family hydrolase
MTHTPNLRCRLALPLFMLLLAFLPTSTMLATGTLPDSLRASSVLGNTLPENLCTPYPVGNTLPDSLRVSTAASSTLPDNLRVSTTASSTLPDSLSALSVAGSALHPEPSAETVLFYSTYGIALTCEDHLPLFDYLRTWVGRTPYRWAGTTRHGADCSGFVQTLYRELYGVALERVAGPQLTQCHRVTRNELREGDLVFFSWNGSYIFHVGMYLRNGLFVHAASHYGVMISRLDEPYWQRAFHSGGRYVVQGFVR